MRSGAPRRAAPGGQDAGSRSTSDKIGKNLGVDVSQLQPVQRPDEDARLPALERRRSTRSAARQIRGVDDHALPRERSTSPRRSSSLQGASGASGTGIDQLVKFLGDSKVPGRRLGRRRQARAPHDDAPRSRRGDAAADAGLLDDHEHGPVRLRDAGQRQRAAGVRGLRRVEQLSAAASGGAARARRAPRARALTRPPPQPARRTPPRRAQEAREPRGARQRREVERVRLVGRDPGAPRRAPARSRPAAAARRRRAARRRCARRARRLGGSGPQSATRPPTSQNASQRSPSGAVGEHEQRARGVQRQAAAGAAQQQREALAAAAQPGRALEALRRRPRRASAASTWRSIARRGSRRREQRRARRRAGGGRGSGRGRPGTATGSAPSARTPRDARGSGSRRPQWRSPNSEVSCSTQLDGRRRARAAARR